MKKNWRKKPHGGKTHVSILSCVIIKYNFSKIKTINILAYYIKVQRRLNVYILD